MSGIKSAMFEDSVKGAYPEINIGWTATPIFYQVFHSERAVSNPPHAYLTTHVMSGGGGGGGLDKVQVFSESAR